MRSSDLGQGYYIDIRFFIHWLMTLIQTSKYIFLFLSKFSRFTVGLQQHGQGLVGLLLMTADLLPQDGFTTQYNTVSNQKKEDIHAFKKDIDRLYKCYEKV